MFMADGQSPQRTCNSMCLTIPKLSNGLRKVHAMILYFTQPLDWNLVLDLAGGALSNRNNIQIYQSNNSSAQHWKLDSSNYTQGAIESYRFPHSVLGKPTGPEQPTAHGAYQNFHNGTAYWNRSQTLPMP